MPSLEEVTKNQLKSLDDTDCYASIWEEILSRQRDETTATKKSLWGGRGKGGRGLARRTIQPRDVKVENVTLQFLGTTDAFLVGATLKLLHNRIYSLIGRTGSGKSSLLRRMSSGKIPGWSPQWSSLYIPPDLPPELMELCPMQVVHKYMNRCESDAKTATKSRMDDLENQMESLDINEEQEEIERIYQEMEKLEEVMDPEEDFLETREVLAMLKDLRIDPNSPCRNLSLSQQKELLLLVARLFSPLVNLLLLDEPARNLEVMGLLRLRRQIESTNATVLMVSHDVDLINDVCTDIIDLHARRLYYYPGNYDSYRLMKEQRATHALQQSRAMDKKTDQLKSTLRNLKEQPVPRRKGGAKKKAKAIASHRKKMEWHQDSMKALDSSLEVLPERKGLTAAQRLKLAETIKEVPDKAVQFALPPTASQWGEPLIVAYDVGYGTDEDLISAQQNVSPDFLATIDDSGKLIIKKRDGFLFDCVDVSIEEGSINCLLGPHDSSSFLLKILAKKLQPVEGTVHHASGLQVGYCSAQIINELTSSIDATTTALEYLTPRYPQKTEKDIRGHLTLFGLSPESQAKTPLCYLSGGESFRFALAVLMLDDPPVLCIENPTSSLDVESVNALIHGLQNWNGTLVMTSVDAFFLRSLDGVKCFVIVPEEGKLRRISSEMQGIDGYLRAFKYTEW